MSDNIYILEQLKANNPFISVASPLPWENKTPDVAQLNAAVSAQIEQLILNKRRESSLPLAGLIFGGIGMGKTHMLTRILRKLRKNAWHAIFVNVKAFTNPKRVTQELLSEIFISMTETHSNKRSQFGMLMSFMMDVYHERRREDGFTDSNMPPLKDYLKRDMPKLSKSFLKCMLIYLGTSDPIVRDKVIDWLREGLDDEDSLALGLPMREVETMEDAACESSAKSIIDSLGIVLSYARVPMIVCFDELDTMEGKNELIRAWGDTIGFIMNNISGMLPLCFVKNDVWYNEFTHILPHPIIERLSNVMKMNACSLQQAQQLIHDRIAFVFSDGVEEKYTWLISRMENTLKPGMSPREVIRVANKIINTGEPDDPIQEAYIEEFKKVQAEPRSWPPNSDHMALAARTWLEAHEGCEISATTWEKYIKIFGTYGDQHIALAMPVPKTASTATAFLNKCFKFMHEYSGCFCCYVKEEKAHKSTWKVFGAKLVEFSQTGGHVLELNDESRITWYALTALINRINNGDVSIYSASGSRPATLDDARDFIRSIDLIPGLFTQAKPSPNTPATTKPEPPVIIIEPDVLKVNLMSVLKSSPMKVISVDKALSLLEGRKIHVVRNELLNFLDANKDSFRIYNSTNDVMIGLRGK